MYGDHVILINFRSSFSFQHYGNSQNDVFNVGHDFDNYNSAKGDFGKHSFGNEFLDHWHDVYDKKYASHGSYSKDGKH